jgi:predicted nucleic acid-binding protein
MKAAYVDSSCFVAIALSEPGADRLVGQLASFDRLLSSDLAQAELASALKREHVSGEAEEFLADIGRVMPKRKLSAEVRRVLAAGYLRGADLWHLACALYVDPTADELSFLTLDRTQQGVAKKLGFRSFGI